MGTMVVTLTLGIAGCRQMSERPGNLVQNRFRPSLPDGRPLAQVAHHGTLRTGLNEIHNMYEMGTRTHRTGNLYEMAFKGRCCGK
jgi:hypothetical protein